MPGAAGGGYYYCCPRLEPVGSEHRSATLLNALTEATRYLAMYGTARVWLARERPIDPGEFVILFDVDAGLIHVVGVGPLPEQVRDLLRAGAVPGWRPLDLQQPETPLHELRPLLDSRCYNRLRRSGFASVEATAVTPDAGLREPRNAGPKLIDAVRAATAAVLPLGIGPMREASDRQRHDADPVTAAPDRVLPAAAALKVALIDLRNALTNADPDETASRGSPPGSAGA